MDSSFKIQADKIKNSFKEIGFPIGLVDQAFNKAATLNQ